MRLWCFLLLSSFQFLSAQNLSSFSKDTILMGCAFTLTAVHQDDLKAKDAVYSGIEEINRIEQLISSWKVNSQTTLINNNAGIQAVSVDKELFDLIDRSLKFSSLSNGYFDISFASLDKIWIFNKQEQSLPNKYVLNESIAKIDFNKIVLDQAQSTVFLQDTGMKIGFGAIGKGYAADRAKELMKSKGIENGVVNAAGDILAWGTKPDGKMWQMGIADPENPNEIISSLAIGNQAVVTSGSYEKYLYLDGVRYGHIINPKTGMPVKGLLSVTIIAQTAEMADAMATTVFVLGEKDGLDLVNHLKGVECIIINDKNNFLYSDGISLNLLHEPKN